MVTTSYIRKNELHAFMSTHSAFAVVMLPPCPGRSMASRINTYSPRFPIYPFSWFFLFVLLCCLFNVQHCFEEHLRFQTRSRRKGDLGRAASGILSLPEQSGSWVAAITGRPRQRPAKRQQGFPRQRGRLLGSGVHDSCNLTPNHPKSPP